MRLSSKQILVLALVGSLTGCIDISQHISKDKAGNTNIYLKAGVSKAIMEMAKSEGADNSDPFAGLSNLQELPIMKGLPSGTDIKAQKIDNDTEMGFSITVSLNVQKLIKQKQLDSEGVNEFIPIDRGNRITIDMPVSTDSESASEANPVADAMLTAFKYRLTIGKSYLSKLSRVVVSTPHFDYKPDVVELPDIFIVEIPMSYIISNSKPCQIIIEK